MIRTCLLLSKRGFAAAAAATTTASENNQLKLTLASPDTVCLKFFRD